MNCPERPDRPTADRGCEPAGSPLAAQEKPQNSFPFCNLPKTEAGHTCCLGTDVPGVGLVHSPGCPILAAKGILRNERAYVAGEVPLALRGFLDEDRTEEAEDRRQCLLGKLIFAARDLAQQNLITDPVFSFARRQFDGSRAWCRECQITEHLGRLAHGATCRTGRVLGIIADLCESSRSATRWSWRG